MIGKLSETLLKVCDAVYMWSIPQVELDYSLRIATKPFLNASHLSTGLRLINPRELLVYEYRDFLVHTSDDNRCQDMLTRYPM